MMRDLLWRGMLAGILAAFLAALFASTFAEPQIDGAIAFEAAHEAPAMPGMAPEEELVSRETQKTAGLYTAMLLYGAAVGGIFALVFAYGYGRMTTLGPRSFALLLALVAFVVIVAVPAIKYPPTPPAVGLHETVRLRTAAFFAMIGYSVLAAIAGNWIRRQFAGLLSAIDAALVGLFGFVVIVALLQFTLPVVDEVPVDFPATLLWQFRLTALGAQGVLWIGTGLIFGTLAQRCLLTRR